MKLTEYRYKTVVYRSLYVRDHEKQPEVPNNWELVAIKPLDTDATGGK